VDNVGVFLEVQLSGSEMYWAKSSNLFGSHQHYIVLSMCMTGEERKLTLAKTM